MSHVRMHKKMGVMQKYEIDKFNGYDNIDVQFTGASRASTFDRDLINSSIDFGYGAMRNHQSW